MPTPAGVAPTSWRGITWARCRPRPPAAALLTDYILTVAVSISSGVAQVTSAFPDLYPYRVEIASRLVMFVMIINLRGVKESGAIFAIPTYFFVCHDVTTVGRRLLAALTGNLGTVSTRRRWRCYIRRRRSRLFLILRAFAGGTTALTGVEAISNGITAFKEPRSRNAGITLVWMSCILGFLLLGITYLAGRIGAVPSEARDSDLAARPHRIRRPRPALPADDRRDGAHPDHGRQYRVCRFPATWRSARRGWLSAAPVDLPRQPARVLARHRCPGPDRLCS